MAASPMFPLGAVVLPGEPLPLHVFEPRYRALVRDCLAGTPDFGVVLIERGSEVGGGDVRRPVGTVVRIVDATEADDGRWALVAVGLHRVRVRAWLPDDPYPRAEVEEWPDESGASADEVLGGYEACARAPLGAYDRYCLLEAPGHVARMTLLAALMAEYEDDLRLRTELDGPRQ